MTAVFALQRKKLGCVKTLQNLLFQLAKFCILDAKFDGGFFFFLQKTAGTVQYMILNGHRKDQPH